MPTKKYTRKHRRGFRWPQLYPASIILTSLVCSIASPVYAVEEPHQQDFVVTAYYSPKPNQCCYYRGSYEAEITFNGGGTKGADGTKVYPGMIAAPREYSFGTRISLPELGVVGTVHDRGGRIIAWDNDTHRIDLWMGEGEEGLARSLEWGARKMTGTVYPAGGAQPAEKWSLALFPSPASALALLPKASDASSMLSATFGDKKYAIRTLQTALKNLGYFNQAVTDLFGTDTRQAVASFQKDYGIDGDGTKVDEKTYAALTLAKKMDNHPAPIDTTLRRGMRGANVKELQRILRYLGFYKGRTDGVFDEDVRKAVIVLQKEQSIVQSDTSDSAGIVGTKTKAAIAKIWKAQQVKDSTDMAMLKMKITKDIQEKQIPARYVAKGDSGKDVRTLQTLLANMGYMKAATINGHFGDATQAALIAYQKDKGLIKKETDTGAGNFGPATKQTMTTDTVNLAWQKVRANGVKAL